MKIKEIDRPTLRMLRDEIDLALAAVGKRHGIAITLGKGRFDSQHATYSLEIAVVGENGKAFTKEREAFEQFAEVYGLKATDIDKTFSSRGKTYTITGLNLNAQRMPVLAVREDGKRFKFAPEAVKLGLVATR